MLPEFEQMEFSDASLERLRSINDVGIKRVMSPNSEFDQELSVLTQYIFSLLGKHHRLCKVYEV